MLRCERRVTLRAMKGPLVIAVLVLGACSTADGPDLNHPPFVVSASPAVGDIVTPSAGSSRDIAVTLSDEDVDDTLSVRFLVDYPGNGDAAHLVRQVAFPPSGAMVRSPIHIQPTCQSLAIGPGLHRFMLSVSDRPFLDTLTGEDVDPEAPLDSAGSGANRVRVVWLLNCP
jgi:hypothetical protein